MSSTLFVGLDCEPTRELAAALSAELVAPPPLPDADGWAWTFADDVARFAASLDALPTVDRVVVCTWLPEYPARPLVDVDTAAWMAEVERPLALWYAVVAAAAERCADGGAIAIVVERPAPIDSTDNACATAVAEGLLTSTRSIALTHGPRGVRANAVGTVLSTAPETLPGHAPSLASYPGTPGREVAGAVRMVLSPDAVGVTGNLVRADSGRA
jgi:NAD(P)-dependent dehydrogenase (short-subunit alcohol dehydrogenase family)